ncbi:MAG TPA: hypothetical protein PKJ08_01265 [Candidatus Cloacimonadota bacterium]|jgi:hypothetical protein|nr:hypothetical protein [Candidatus Cloacimonadota bacterium]HPM03773.1 hypothetical protein [Candidatus Cloacimonadota bacterium]
MDKFVYHSSSISSLTIINPSTSTHEKEWVYATKDIVASALFISSIGGDFTCAIGRDLDSGIMYLCERFKGAFDLRYNGKSGSIYMLSSELFLENRTSWDEEVVSESAVKPLKEIMIDNAKEYLLFLESEGKLIIKYFPDRFDDIPEDDSDLIDRAVLWTQQFGDRIIEQVKLYHPNLMNEILQKLNN